jgi:hypothetical protein
MAGLLGKIKSKSGYPETQNFFPSESRGRYPTMKAWNGKVASIQAGSRTVDERFYHPTGAESYYRR